MVAVFPPSQTHSLGYRRQDHGGLWGCQHYAEAELASSPSPGPGHGQEVAEDVLLREEHEGQDNLNLPEFSLEPPVAEKNFKHTPAESAELELVAGVVAGFMKKGLVADDLLARSSFTGSAPYRAGCTRCAI